MLKPCKGGLFPNWPLANSWELRSWNVLTSKSVLHAQGIEAHLPISLDMCANSVVHSDHLLSLWVAWSFSNCSVTQALCACMSNLSINTLGS